MFLSKDNKKSVFFDILFTFFDKIGYLHAFGVLIAFGFKATSKSFKCLLHTFGNAVHLVFNHPGVQALTTRVFMRQPPGCSRCEHPGG